MARPLRIALDHLEVLDAIDRTGSFAAAARTLHKAPSAVSYAIKQLEDALELALFDRSGHRAKLTPAGHRILEGGRQVLQTAHALENTAKQLVDDWEPVLRVVVDGALPMAPLTCALRFLATQEVPTRVQLHVEYQEGVPARFIRDDAHVMMLLGEHPLDLPAERRPLPPLEMLLVAGPAHPLASGRDLQRSDLEPHLDVVVRDSSPAFALQPRETYLDSQHTLRLSDFHTKRRVLLDGVGFGWIPRHLITDDLATGRLVILDHVDSATFRYAPQLVTRRDQPLGRAGRMFVQELLRAYQEENSPQS